ncbi:TA system antitoxin ParD family protein, partial [Phenylobacterium sp.]|uniref:TA system antitoxin ParD family protein n=1 Tax=Phenylobacterium sp. TaxID=1871053 RepID=UPI002F3F74AA
MAARFSTVRLNSELIDAARGEADLLHRSLGGQIEHWARLGRAIEEAGLPLARVRQALEGSLKVEALSRIEQDQVFA